MSDDKKSWLSHLLQHDTAAEQTAGAPKPTASSTQANSTNLSGDNTVQQWLDHPIGGAIFRDMLAKAGQKENVLGPVRHLKLKRLISMSQGRFTDEMLAGMVKQVSSGTVPDDISISPEPQAQPKVDSSAAAPQEWQEVIVPGRFAGKTIIVTGAGSGIGRATASRIAREGGHVIAMDVSKERLAEFAASLPDASITIVAGDITNDESIAAVVRAAGNTIDGLANVAGIMDNMTPLHEVSDAIWDKVMAVNVTGMMKLTRAVLPIMLQKQRGAIVNVASEASFRGSAAGVAYTTSKHAVVGLTKSAAFMYAQKGIRVNAVAPGPVLTNIEARFDSALGEERVNALLATAPDAVEAPALAASITFLLSDDSININGAILPSDGGWSAQ